MAPSASGHFTKSRPNVGRFDCCCTIATESYHHVLWEPAELWAKCGLCVAFKPRDEAWKLSDRDGLYLQIEPSDTKLICPF